jgi:hypothetical protein
MIQVKGHNHIRLEPKEFCASRGCTTIYDTLYQNDLRKNFSQFNSMKITFITFSIFLNLKVLFSAKLWNLSYSPFIEGNPELNLALLIGGIYE